MNKITHEFDLYGKHYVLDTGELAKQATGAVVVRQGDTILLCTAVVSKERKDLDFFPLTDPSTISRLVVGYRRDRYLSHFGERFIELTQQALQG